MKHISLVQLIAALSLSLSANAAEVTQPEGASGPSALTMAAVQKGVLTCANQIDKVAKFTGFGPSSAAAILPLTEQPDRSIVAMFMANSVGRDQKSYVSATFAPGQANGCAATYDAIIYWDENCTEIASKVFGEFKRVENWDASLDLLDGGRGTKVVLMDAATGCVSIKKELINQ